MFDKQIENLKIAKQYSQDNLKNVLVDGQADNGRLKVVVDGNKVVRQILISQELFDEANKELIEDYTLQAINKAIAKVKLVCNELDRE